MEDSTIVRDPREERAELEDRLDRAFHMSRRWLGEMLDVIPAALDEEIHTTEGFETLEHWIMNRYVIGFWAASRKVDVAMLLDEAPCLREAFHRGGLSYEQLKSLSEVGNEDNAEALLKEVEGLSYKHTYRLVKAIKEVSAEDDHYDHDYRTLEMRWEDRSLILFCVLPSDMGVMVEETIERLARSFPREPKGEATIDQLRADALHELASGNSSNTSRPGVVVHVDYRALMTGGPNARLQGGPPISVDLARMLMCDSKVRYLVEDLDGNPLLESDSGSTIPGSIRRAVYDRDEGSCRFPGCLRRKGLHVHHITYSSEDGKTLLKNLVTLCDFHHRYVHRKNYRIHGPPPKISIHRPGRDPVKVGPPPITPETIRLFQEEKRSLARLPV